MWRGNISFYLFFVSDIFKMQKQKLLTLFLYYLLPPGILFIY